MTTEVPVEARPARRADRPALLDTLAAAFADDPVMVHLLPPDLPRRDARLRGLLALDLARSLRLGGAWTTTDAGGAAVWLPPHRWRPTWWEALLQTPAALRVFGDRVRPAAAAQAAMHEHHPREPHWYLLYLAARPGRQGRGLGTALLRPVLEHCDRAGAAAYLEATTEASCGLYRRHGFEERGQFRLPDGPPLWPMWREPRDPSRTRA